MIRVFTFILLAFTLSACCSQSKRTPASAGDETSQEDTVHRMPDQIRYGRF